MEAKYIGLCAMFLGIDVVAHYTGTPKDEVQAFKTLVSYENLSFFDELRTSVLDVVGRVGLQHASEILSIPLKTLALINDSSRYGMSAIKPELSPRSKNLNLIRNERLEMKRSLTKKANIKQKSYENPVTDLHDIDELKQRVARLYNNGVNIRVIQSLYDLRNGGIIHCWGGWERSPSFYARADELKQQIIAMRAGGIRDDEICKNLKIKKNHLSEIMGEINRRKLIFMKKDIKNVLMEYATKRRKDKLAKYHGISKKQINYWLDRCEKKQLDTVYDLGIMGPIEILNALETYYICEKLDLAAKELGIDENVLERIVQKFEEKMDDYYGENSIRTNWNKKYDIIWCKEIGKYYISRDGDVKKKQKIIE
ncbi:unnamed protein product [Blepharisma stoltei]|uniref:Uncharacterized protein n=1 Tax=Blepharisma stoltei TaxID=1481888 RepID=A0AAU9J980_9CILI|nr:unnamed protein product [Blepharisma stoltei]